MGGFFSNSGSIQFTGNGRKALVQVGLTYFDKAGLAWHVPAGTEVDGASIPRILWTLIGSPWSGKYRRASIVHDHYCNRKSRSSKATHQVWCEMLDVEGVRWWRKALMGRAVKLFGPKWKMKDED